MYKEDHKERLTRADIQKRLQGKPRDIVFLVLVFLVPVLLLSLFYLLNETLLSIIIAVLSIITVIILIYYLVLISKDRAEASRGKFTVIETELDNVETVVRTVIRRRAIIDKHFKIFHFTNGMSYSVQFFPYSPKKYLDSHDTRIAFSMEHSNPGNVFYLVTLDTDPKNVRMIFSGIIFKYEDK